MEKIELKVGDLVQINPEHDPIFGGHFMVVTEPKPWGAQGYCHAFPYESKDGRQPGGLAYYRCKFQDMELVGKAKWIFEITKFLKTCIECGKVTDVHKYASTTCSGCKMEFCCALSSDCFSNFHKKLESCNGTAQTITNPQWIINLRGKDDH